MSKELENTVIDYTDNFNFDNLIYNKPRKEHGRYIGKIKYKVIGKKAHQKIIIKTPRLKCVEDLKITEDRCSIELQLFNNNVDFYQFLIKFDDKNIMSAFRNRNEWFGKDFPLDIIDEFYKPILKMNSNKCPTLRVKILYDELKNFDLELLKKDSELICYLECVGLRFLTQQFTMVWKLNYFTTPPPDTENNTDNDYYESGLIDRDEALSDVLSSTDSSDDYKEPVPQEPMPQESSLELPKETAPELPKEPVPQETVSPELPKEPASPELPKEPVAPELPKETRAETLPEVAVKETLPEVAVKETLPEVAVKETLPEVAVKETLPEVVAKETDVKEVEKPNLDLMDKVTEEIDKLEERLAKVEFGGDKKVAVNKKKIIKCANNRRRIWL